MCASFHQPLIGCLTSPFSLLISFITLCFFFSFSFSRSLTFFSLSSRSLSFALSLVEWSVEAVSNVSCLDGESASAWDLRCTPTQTCTQMCECTSLAPICFSNSLPVLLPSPSPLLSLLTFNFVDLSSTNVFSLLLKGKKSSHRQTHTFI